MDLVDLAEREAQAERLKRHGMDLASVAQELIAPGWNDRAYDALVKIAREQPSLHVDDVLRAFTEKPSHANSWGSVYARAIKEHIIIHSGRVKPCIVDPTKRKHLSPIYTSLLYRRT